MVYAYDQWAQLPVRDLYDTQMMLASINAYKDMYEKGAKEMKEFRDKYDDFYTSIPEHQERYNNIINDVYNTINRYYDMGIDPLRTVEGRMALTRKINSLPYDEIGKIKASAKRKEEYDKNAAALQKAGLWDPEFAQWQLRGWKPLNDDGTVNTFTEQSPMPYQGIFGLTSPLVKDIKPHVMSKDQVVGSGYEYDPRLQYTGVASEDIDKALSDGIPGLKGNPEYDFHRERIRRELTSKGLNPTEQDIDNEFQRQAAISHYATRTPLKTDVDPIHALSAMRSRGGGSRSRGSGGDDDEIEYDYSWREALVKRGISNMFGLDADQYDPDTMGEKWDSRQLKLLENINTPDQFANEISMSDNVTNAQLADYLDRKIENDGSFDLSSSDVIYTNSGLSVKAKYKSKNLFAQSAGGSTASGKIKGGVYGDTTGRTATFKTTDDVISTFAEIDVYDENNNKIGTGWKKLPSMDTAKHNSKNKDANKIILNSGQYDAGSYRDTGVIKRYGTQNSYLNVTPWLIKNTPSSSKK